MIPCLSGSDLPLLSDHTFRLGLSYGLLTCLHTLPSTHSFYCSHRELSKSKCDHIICLKFPPYSLFPSGYSPNNFTSPIRLFFLSFPAPVLPTASPDTNPSLYPTPYIAWGSQIQSIPCLILSVPTTSHASLLWRQPDPSHPQLGLVTSLTKPFPLS